jgi:hypothetical protein
MVRNKDHPVLIKYRFCPALIKLVNGNGSGNIVSQGYINTGIDQVARFDMVNSGMCRPEFFP